MILSCHWLTGWKSLRLLIFFSVKTMEHNIRSPSTWPSHLDWFNKWQCDGNYYTTVWCLIHTFTLTEIALKDYSIHIMRNKTLCDTVFMSRCSRWRRTESQWLPCLDVVCTVFHTEKQTGFIKVLFWQRGTSTHQNNAPNSHYECPSELLPHTSRDSKSSTISVLTYRQIFLFYLRNGNEGILFYSTSHKSTVFSHVVIWWIEQIWAYCIVKNCRSEDSTKHNKTIKFYIQYVFDH